MVTLRKNQDFHRMARATAVSKCQVPTIQTVQKMLYIRLCQYLDRLVIERLSPDRHKIVFKELGDEHPHINAEDVIAPNRIQTRSGGTVIAITTAVTKSVGEAQPLGNGLRDDRPNTGISTMCLSKEDQNKLIVSQKIFQDDALPKRVRRIVL